MNTTEYKIETSDRATPMIYHVPCGDRFSPNYEQEFNVSQTLRACTQHDVVCPESARRLFDRSLHGVS